MCSSSRAWAVYTPLKACGRRDGQHDGRGGISKGELLGGGRWIRTLHKASQVLESCHSTPVQYNDVTRVWESSTRRLTKMSWGVALPEMLRCRHSVECDNLNDDATVVFFYVYSINCVSIKPLCCLISIFCQKWTG